jgi:FKBP-type peptidyl-prolyl cis-trans isomerase FklB
MHSRSLLGIVVAGVAVWATLLGGAGPRAAQDHPADTTPDAELIAYGVGLFLGEEVREGLAMDGLKLDLDRVAAGFADGLHGRESIHDREDLDDVLELLHEEMQERMVRRRLQEDPAFKKLHDDNLAKSQAFQEANAQRAGVVTLENGLQYRVMRAGDGPSPGPDSVIIANFQAKRLDGLIVSEGRGVEVRPSEIRKGAAVLVQMMKVGDAWEVAIPPHLAYGPGGDPPRIGPNEVIHGTIEILEIKE